MSFSSRNLELGSAKIISSELHEDHRGFLTETYNQDKFASLGIKGEFIHEFCSKSQKKVIRGLHYQKAPLPQAKLVFCISGEVKDVVVDVRPVSSTFKQYESIDLEKGKGIYIPKGFAHGFQTVSEEAILYYKTTENYSKDYQRGIAWNDPELDIKWPIENPILSSRDRNHPTLEKVDNSELKFKV